MKRITTLVAFIATALFGLSTLAGPAQASPGPAGWSAYGGNGTASRPVSTLIQTDYRASDGTPVMRVRVAVNLYRACANCPASYARATASVQNLAQSRINHVRVYGIKLYQVYATTPAIANYTDVTGRSGATSTTGSVTVREVSPILGVSFYGAVDVGWTNFSGTNGPLLKEQSVRTENVFEVR